MEHMLVATGTWTIVGIIGGLVGVLIGGIRLVVWLLDRRRAKTEGHIRLKSYRGKTFFFFGGNIVCGACGLLKMNDMPILSAVVRNGRIFKKRKRLLVSANLFDEKGELVVRIEDNHWVLRKNKYFTKAASRRELKVVNTRGLIALHVKALKKGVVVVNGVFYLNGRIFHATDHGTSFGMPFDRKEVKAHMLKKFEYMKQSMPDVYSRIAESFEDRPLREKFAHLKAVDPELYSKIPIIQEYLDDKYGKSSSA